MRKVPEAIIRAVIYQRLQAGLPSRRVLPPFEIIKRPTEVPNWDVNSSDLGLALVVRDLQNQFNLEIRDLASLVDDMSLDRVSRAPECPQCCMTMRRAAYLPSQDGLPAVTGYRCDTCKVEQTFEEDV